jgi:acetyl esterase/lipase
MALAAGLAVLAAACTDSRDDATPPVTTIGVAPQSANIAYGPPMPCGGDLATCVQQQTLDIYPSSLPGPNPVLVWIHGGGFVGGDKSTSVNQALQDQLDDGWDVVAVNYRLSTTDARTRFPAAVQDVKRAVRWIKANAAAHDWDPNHVVAIGHSAGGNLAEMLAVTSGNRSLEPNGLPPDLAAVDSSVAGAVALAPVSDLATYRKDPGFGTTVNTYLGCTRACSTRLAAGSVQTHVDAAAAPILAIHGVDDPLAQPSQAVLVAAAYGRAGIADRFHLIVVKDGPKDHRGHDPDVPRFEGQITEFLNGLRQVPG